MVLVVCFFKQKTAYEMRISDWSSDVCSSDLYTNVLHASIKYLGIVIAMIYGLSLTGGVTALATKLRPEMFVWDAVGWSQIGAWMIAGIDRKSTRLNSSH